MIEGQTYQFKDLEKLLFFRWDEGICLRVKNILHRNYAIMHVFTENFSSAYQSGDGVLFYDDGETHSANPDDEFVIVKIIKINPSN